MMFVADDENLVSEILIFTKKTVELLRKEIIQKKKKQ